ncbi:hypothetical protein SARC_15450, partial [Sphaeroforma arctica JP610]
MALATLIRRHIPVCPVPKKDSEAQRSNPHEHLEHHKSHYGKFQYPEHLLGIEQER